jgi:hypothetical protein
MEEVEAGLVTEVVVEDLSRQLSRRKQSLPRLGGSIRSCTEGCKEQTMLVRLAVSLQTALGCGGRTHSCRRRIPSLAPVPPQEEVALDNDPSLEVAPVGRRRSTAQASHFLADESL